MTQIPQGEILMDAPNHGDGASKAPASVAEARVATAEKRRCATLPKPRA